MMLFVKDETGLSKSTNIFVVVTEINTGKMIK